MVMISEKDSMDYMVTEQHTWQLLREPIYRLRRASNSPTFASREIIPESEADQLALERNTLVVKRCFTWIVLESPDDWESIADDEVPTHLHLVWFPRPTCLLEEHLKKCALKAQINSHYRRREHAPFISPPQRKVGRPPKPASERPRRTQLTEYNRFMKLAMQQIKDETLSTRDKMKKVGEMWQKHKLEAQQRG
jgi:hypothetical protein